MLQCWKHTQRILVLKGCDTVGAAHITDRSIEVIKDKRIVGRQQNSH